MRLLAAAVGLVALVGLGGASPVRAQQPPTPSAPTVVRSPLDARAVGEAMRRLAADVTKLGGRVGASAIDLDTGASIAEHEATSVLNPASNAKLVTAAAALRRLGSQHRWQTGLYGTIRANGTIEELCLRGNGDPSLRTRDLWTMVHEIHDAGAREVGSIVVDQRAFDDHWAPPVFESQPNEWAAFRAPVAAVSIASNTVTFTIRPGPKRGAEATVSVDPPGFVDVSGRIQTANKGDPDAVTLELSRSGKRLAAKVGGTVPAGTRVVRFVRRVDDPSLLAGYALRAVLLEAGVRVTGEVRLGGERQKELLAARRSPPLGEVLAALGKDSDNFDAEMIFKSLAVDPKGPPASSERGAELALATLDELGARGPGTVVKNGSGLFDANRISARSTTTLLRAMYLDPKVGPEFVSHLAIAGVDGTLRSRLKAWAPERAIRAKTGTLAAVTALSGYVLGPRDRPSVAFAFLVNGVGGKTTEAREAIDRAASALAAAVYGKEPARVAREDGPRVVH